MSAPDSDYDHLRVAKQMLQDYYVSDAQHHPSPEVRIAEKLEVIAEVLIALVDVLALGIVEDVIGEKD